MDLAHHAALRVLRVWQWYIHLPSAPSAHNLARRKRNAFPITDTELRLIAALAIIGLKSQPKTG